MRDTCNVTPMKKEKLVSETLTNYLFNVSPSERFIIDDTNYQQSLECLFGSLTFPITLRRSLRNLDDRIAATSTLRAPRGVTKEAGAKL